MTTLKVITPSRSYFHLTLTDLPSFSGGFGGGFGGGVGGFGGGMGGFGGGFGKGGY